MPSGDGAQGAIGGNKREYDTVKTALFIAAFGLAALPASAKEENVRTHISNGSHSATVTQSGSPKDATVKVERRPGYTRIEQRSGGNSATVIQSNGTTPIVSGDPALDRMMRELTRQ